MNQRQELRSSLKDVMFSLQGDLVNMLLIVGKKCVNVFEENHCVILCRFHGKSVD